MTDWQAIETAPKDGTEVLIFFDGSWRIARWANDPEGEDPRGDFWWRSTCNRYSFGGKFMRRNPTHWQPLPANPPQDNIECILADQEREWDAQRAAMDLAWQRAGAA